VNVEIRDNRFTTIVDEKVAVERVAGGFDFTEGPVWNPAEKCLIFSDMPGDCMRRWDGENGIRIFRKPSNMANGNAYDHQQRLVTCEHATSRVTRTEHDGKVVTLADRYQGAELNSPNDIVVKSDGTIYFTDPDFGRRERFGIPREKQLSFQGVYRIDPKTFEVTLLLDDFQQPNGLTFSPDESLLYINDTPRQHIRVFEVEKDGTVGIGRLFAEITGTGEGRPDGLKTDSRGNVFCTGPGGIHILDSEGITLGVVRIPEKTANFTWGEEDLMTVFATASTSLYRFRVKVPGRRPHHAPQ
jgi:gluconolactonase